VGDLLADEKSPLKPKPGLSGAPAADLLADVCCAKPGAHIPHTNATAKLEVRKFQKFLLIGFVTVECIVRSCWVSIFVSSVTAGYTVFDWDFTSSVLA
jgi:hypothetical protein